MGLIRKVAVLGAGVMGSGIAAHCANAGIPVLLLDIVPPEPARRRRASKAFRDSSPRGLDEPQEAKPAASSPPRDAELIEVGNFDDDLASARRVRLGHRGGQGGPRDQAARCSRKLEPLLAGTRSSRRTPRACRSRTCSQGRGAVVQEALPGHALLQPAALHEAARARRRARHRARGRWQRMARFGEDVLGKGIVWARTRPTSSPTASASTAMMRTSHEHAEGGLTVEEVDAIFGLPMGARRARCSAPPTSSASTPRPRRAELLRDADPRRGPRDVQGAGVHREDGRREACSATRPGAASTRR